MKYFLKKENNTFRNNDLLKIERQKDKNKNAYLPAFFSITLNVIKVISFLLKTISFCNA